MKNVFANFYGLEAFPTRCDKNLDYLLAEKKVLDIGSKILFNADVYKKRIRCSAETFLIEANHRGKKIGKRVHVLIVGLGLGVWKITHLQVSIYVTRSFIENRVLEWLCPTEPQKYERIMSLASHQSISEYEKDS